MFLEIPKTAELRDSSMRPCIPNISSPFLWCDGGMRWRWDEMDAVAKAVMAKDSYYYFFWLSSFVTAKIYL